MRNWSILFLALLLCRGSLVAAAQTEREHRQVYLGLIFHVRAAEVDKFVRSNRQYSTALASHDVHSPLLRWNAYAEDATHTYLWLYPIEHLSDIEELSEAQSQLDKRIKAEHWDAGSDLHYSVEYTEEFVIRDEPSLSRRPTGRPGLTKIASSSSTTPPADTAGAIRRSVNFGENTSMHFRKRPTTRTTEYCGFLSACNARYGWCSTVAFPGNRSEIGSPKKQSKLARSVPRRRAPS